MQIHAFFNVQRLGNPARDAVPTDRTIKIEETLSADRCRAWTRFAPAHRELAQHATHPVAAANGEVQVGGRHKRRGVLLGDQTPSECVPHGSQTSVGKLAPSNFI